MSSHIVRSSRAGLALPLAAAVGAEERKPPVVDAHLHCFAGKDDALSLPSEGALQARKGQPRRNSC